MPRKDIRLPYEICIKMTVKQIKQTEEYKSLTPLGKKNRSGAYKYGNKSTMRKEQLCRALDNPKKYQMKIKELKAQKKNAGTRKRETRKGECLVPKRKLPCNTSQYPHEGYTTTGKKCCYKKKQSEKVKRKRMNINIVS